MEDKLCDECQRISIDALRSYGGFEHSSLLQNIDLGISYKCALCSEIEKALTRYVVRERLHRYVQYERQCVRFHVNPDQIGDLFVTVGCTLEDILWTNGRLVSESRGNLVRSFRIFADYGTAAANICQYKNPFPEPFSDEAFHLIEQWLHRCLESHHHCRTASSNMLPSRVIDVGPADGSRHPYLYVPSESSNYAKLPDVSQRYVALSYCWGSHLWAGKDPYITTASSLEARKRGIRMTDLPQTIRDAVVITRRLGIRYLWVDALCILQGSDAPAKADWERESSKMADVYGSAFLTIAAASARSVHEGIFHDRKPKGKQVVMRFSAENNGSLDNLVYIQHNPEFRDCINEPLYHRGWTMQERILSPRVLVFTRDQLVWNCQTQNMTESGTEMNPLGQQRLGALEDLGDRHTLEFWHSVVQNYTSRYLTNATDKLPALSGLAAALHQRTGDKYLAGLWRKSVLDDLLWINKANYSDLGNIVAPSRQPGYRAPSWSWTSVDGNIKFYHSYEFSVSYFARCLSYHITLSGIDEFGAVSGGWIKLRGPLIQVLRLGLERGSNLMVQSEAGRYSNPVALGRTILDAGEEDIAISGSESDNEFSDIWVLRIRKEAGLILRAVDSKDSSVATDDGDSVSTIDDNYICAAEDSGAKYSTKRPANGILQRVRNIAENLSWKRSNAVILPPVPKRFRRLGLIELNLTGTRRFGYCEERTVTII